MVAVARFEEVWDFHGVLDFIERRQAKLVAAQFPDEFLGFAIDIVQILQSHCKASRLDAEVSCPMTSLSLVSFLQGFSLSDSDFATLGQGASLQARHSSVGCSVREQMCHSL